VGPEQRGHRKGHAQAALGAGLVMESKIRGKRDVSLNQHQDRKTKVVKKSPTDDARRA